ncbi:MAG TPA: nickel-dependent lactate racemase [Pirellulales bacterium]|nr:nickel-dependent lactate racemase [Pirellulales bacterium]
MKIDFPFKHYESISPGEVPDANVMGVYAPRSAGKTDEEHILSRGIQHPIGTPPLSEMVRKQDRVLILVDDYTRGTPVKKVLPHVLAQLKQAGVSDKVITLLTAQGTHREMTPEEIEKKLGPFAKQFPVHQHRWTDEAMLHRFGTLKDGTPVRANRLLTEADLVMGIVSIVPHRVKGFSGGAKIAFPGVAGPEIQSHLQWQGAQRMSDTVMGEPENPMRAAMEEAARMVGLRFVINLVTGGDKHLAGCFSGEPVASHREGCRLSRDIFSVSLPHRADIVITDSHPADYDLWQSAKGYYSGTMAVKDGGSLIVVAPNPEGVAKNHPVMLEVGYKPFKELRAMVDSGQIKDVVGASILGDLCQIIDKTDCIIVSPGITVEEAKRLGLRYAKTVQDALLMAFEKQGQKAKVAILRQGGHILPQVAGEHQEGLRR